MHIPHNLPQIARQLLVQSIFLLNSMDPQPCSGELEKTRFHLCGNKMHQVSSMICVKQVILSARGKKSSAHPKSCLAVLQWFDDIVLVPCSAGPI